MRRRAAALGALVALAHAGSALAGVFGLVSPNTIVAGPPPFALSGASPFSSGETHVPGHVAARALVEVGLGPDGVPVRVEATQRLRLQGTGDYEFLVPAPATSVAAGPGSESQPGLRRAGVIWQGFADRGRLLSARIALRAGPAAAGLPLRVTTERRGDATAVRLANVTARSVDAALGRTTLAQLARQLRRLRAAWRRSPVAVIPLSVLGTYRRTTKIAVAAPLRVRGTIGGRRLDVVLGPGRSLRRTIVVAGAAPPSVRLRVDLPAPLEIVPTERELARAKDPLVALQTALGDVAAATAYRRYLGFPDPLGASDTAYVYRSVRILPAIRSRAGAGGAGTLAIIVGIALAAVALCGLAALWARS